MPCPMPRTAACSSGRRSWTGPPSGAVSGHLILRITARSGPGGVRPGGRRPPWPVGMTRGRRTPADVDLSDRSDTAGTRPEIHRVPLGRPASPKHHGTQVSSSRSASDAGSSSHRTDGATAAVLLPHEPFPAPTLRQLRPGCRSLGQCPPPRGRSSPASSRAGFRRRERVRPPK